MIYVRTLSRVTFRDIYSYFPCSAWRDLFQDGNKFISFFSHSLSPYYIRISLLCTTSWSNRPNLERTFSRWTLFGVHVCVIDGQSARSLQPAALFSLWQGCVIHKNLQYRVGGWGGINRFWRIILGREIKIVRVRSISVNVLYGTYGRSARDLRNIMTTSRTCCHDSKSACHKLG